jgi:hypothetical protein
MLGRSDPAGATARRLSGGQTIAPGQIGLGVVVLAAALGALVAASRNGQTYWLCVPAGLVAAAAVFPEDGLASGELIGVADNRLLAAKRVLYRNRAARRAA